MSPAPPRRTVARFGQGTVLNYALTLEQAPTKLVARRVSRRRRPARDDGAG